MNMPGFTAEDSLYTSKNQYSFLITKSLATAQAIQPQLHFQRPRDRCIPGCICTWDGDCPCCDSIIDWLH
jgi:hypothetical protein